MYRSVTGQGHKSTSSLTRTSKQAWLADRYYAFDVALPDGNATKDIVYMSTSMRRIFPLPENHIDYRVVYDPVAYRVSLRIQNATELIVNDPFSSEAYQVIAIALSLFCVMCLPKPESFGQMGRPKMRA